VDPKIATSKTPPDNSKSERTSTASQTIPEKKIGSSKTKETQTENVKPIEN